MKILEKKAEQDILNFSLDELFREQMSIISRDVGDAPTLDFFNYHIPAITPGEYNFQVKQTLKVDSGRSIEHLFRSEAAQTIIVEGSKVNLTEQEVYNVYPSANATGDFRNFTPHIALNRSTLPWEEKSIVGKREIPWLALIIVKNDEVIAFNGSQLTIKAEHFHPNLTDNSKQTWQDKLSYLKYLSSAFKSVEGDNKSLVICSRLPEPVGEEDSNILYQAHLIALQPTRVGEAQQDPITVQSDGTITLDSIYTWNFTQQNNDVDFATYVKAMDKNMLRLPYNEHLIGELYTQSILQVLENYNEATLNQLVNDFDTTQIQNQLETAIHFLIRKNREQCFALLDKGAGKDTEVIVKNDVQKIFNTILQNISTSVKDFGVRIIEEVNQEEVTKIETLDKMTLEDFAYDARFKLLGNHQNPTPSLDLPKLKARIIFLTAQKALRNHILNSCFREGYVPLPHYMRRGSKVLSWYRSPLIAYKEVGIRKFQYIKHPEELMRFHLFSQMLDATYSAAWELGRMLTLQNNYVATSIYKWKRKIIHEDKVRYQFKPFELIKNPNTNSEEQANQNALIFDRTIKPWLVELSQLKHIPFNYLVPYEDMIPNESIRFFNIDRMWINALLDGALSIGRVFDLGDEQKMSNAWNYTGEDGEKLFGSGFLLRSDLVKAYPDMIIIKDPKKKNTTTILNGNDADNITLDDLDDTCLPKELRPLGNEILLCIFNEPIQQELQLFLKPMGMRFGFDEIKKNKVRKSVKYSKGENTGKERGQSIETTLKNNRFVSLHDLTRKIEAQNASQFALQMYYKTPKFRLKLNQ